MLHTHKKYGIMKTRTSAGACQTVGGWPVTEWPEPSDYIETPRPLGESVERRGYF